MLIVSNLTCIKQQRPLFTNLSFELRAHELLLVEGPNGSGKSSLLRLLAKLATPSSGDITWQIENDDVHYLGHTNGIKLGLTVAENIALQGRLAAQPPQAQQEILDALKLTTYHHTVANDLSAGQKRKIGLARLFIYPKKMWILDEPLTALDNETQAYFQARLNDHLEKGGVAVISSHHAFTVLPRHTKTVRLPT